MSKLFDDLQENGVVIPKISDFNFYTNEKKFFGSPEYLAPEVSNFNEYTYKSDIWAIGILIYELLAKRLPFKSRKDGLTVKEVRENLKSNDINYSQILDTTPFSNAIKRATNRNPHERPTIREFLELIGD